jgi:hypothetical protein
MLPPRAPSGRWRVVCLAIAAACRTEALEPTTSDAGAGFPEVQAVSCELMGCRNGQHCAVPPGCDTVGVCRDGPSGCTAGIVGSVCTCDGMVSANDGCPRRFAYRIGAYHGFTQRLGLRCDPALRGPLTFQVQVEGAELAAFEGRRVSWRFLPASWNQRTQPAIAGLVTAPVQDGRISWQAPARWEHGELPLALHDLFFYVDVDGDLACDPEEPGGRFVGPDVDLVTLQLRYQLPRPSPNGSYTCEPFSRP